MCIGLSPRCGAVCVTIVPCLFYFTLEWFWFWLAIVAQPAAAGRKWGEATSRFYVCYVTLVVCGRLKGQVPGRLGDIRRRNRMWMSFVVRVGTDPRRKTYVARWHWDNVFSLYGVFLFCSCWGSFRRLLYTILDGPDKRSMVLLDSSGTTIWCKQGQLLMLGKKIVNF